MRALYQERRDVLCAGLESIGWKASIPQATFYAWVPLPIGSDSRSFAKLLLEKCDIVAAPGIGFGSSGEGYIRFALTVPKERIAEAVERIKKRL